MERHNHMENKIFAKYFSVALLFILLSIVGTAAPTKVDASKLFSHPGVKFEPLVDISTLSESCKIFISKTLPENDWSGGFVQVPEDWKNPDSRTINVFYYHNKIPNSIKKPIVFFNGGPFTSFQIRMLSLKKQLESFDKNSRKSTFVMFDQRGVGCSHPTLPQANSIDISQFQNYGSPSIALDAEVIRSKLFGHTPWKIFAQSYGGPIAARYLKYFPKRIVSMHLYSPAFFNSMSDFFANRIEKSQEVLKKFLEHYNNDVRLSKALDRIASSEANAICVLKDQPEKTACGHALTDLILTAIGQGMGRSQNSTEVWDGARQALLDLEQADFTSTENESAKKFYASALGAGAFFHSPSIGIVFSNWSLEFPFVNGNLADDCKEAYSKLNSRGVDTSSLPIDECRIITQYIPKDYREAIYQQFDKVENRELNTQESIVVDMNKNSNIKIYFYVGELDLIVQPNTLKRFSKVKSIKYVSFPDAGHAGWLYKKEVWENLFTK